MEKGCSSPFLFVKTIFVFSLQAQNILHFDLV